MTVVVGKIMSLEVVVGDIGAVVAVGDELALVTISRASVVEIGVRISAVEELVADITCMILEVVSDAVSSGMSISVILSPPAPDPDPGPKLA